MSIRVINLDCREGMAAMDACSVDAIVTDPPYHLTSMVKRLSRSNPTDVEANFTKTIEWQATNPFQSAARGFMGKAWDGGDIAHSPEVWKAALRVAKPGAYLLAFGGTRTFHRLAVAIEDAGWEIRDTVMWVYGSGFPKSHNGPWGGTALKPAWEPIIMARKPLIGTVAANVEKHGTGALNIDACRLAHEIINDGNLADNPQLRGTKLRADPVVSPFGNAGEETPLTSQLGRWPANLIHDGSEEVLAAFPDAPGQQRSVGPEYGDKVGINTFGDYGPRDTFNPRGDTGSAARFFYTAKTSRFDRNDGLVTDDGRKVPADNAYQRGKTLRKNHHPTVKPTDLMRYLCKLVTPKGGTVLDPFMGSGSTLKAAELEGFSAIGIEIDPEYCEIARRRIASDAPLFAEVIP